MRQSLWVPVCQAHMEAFLFPFSMWKISRGCITNCVSLVFCLCSDLMCVPPHALNCRIYSKYPLSIFHCLFSENTWITTEKEARATLHVFMITLWCASGQIEC